MTVQDTETRLPVADKPAVRRAMWRLLRTDVRAMTVVIILNCLAGAAGLASPWLLGKIIDEVGAGTTTSTVDKLALAMLALVAAQILLIRFARYTGHRFGQRTLARLREEFVRNTLSLPTPVVERAGTGDLMTRSSADVATVGNTVRDAAPDIFLATLQICLVFIAVLLLNPYLGLIALVGIPAIWAAARWYLRRARHAYLDEGRAHSEVSEMLAATVEGARTVEALRLHPQRSQACDHSIDSMISTRIRTLFLRSVLFPVADISHTTAVGAMLLIGGGLYLNDVVSLGAVIAATLYIWQLVDPINWIMWQMEQLQRSGASFARLEGVALATPIEEPSTAVPTDDQIAVKNVRYAYTGDHDVLHGLDLAVYPGERLAIVGPSGAGKSTLGRLVAGFDRPRTGTVTVGGVPVADLGPDDLRSRIVLVTQEHHVFLATLRENLAIAAPTASDQTLTAALSAVDAHWVHDLPAGLDTVLGAGGVRLDPAQEQQIALARVVLADPHTVILDEATSLLSPTAARHAERSLASVLAGRTVIAIAHRLHTARDADRIAVVEDGRVSESGSHDELVSAGGSYAALWRAWHGPDS